MFYPHGQAVVLGKGGAWPRRSQNGGGLPILTNGGDQTKNQVILHVSSPTKPYRIPCSRCETLWSIRIGLPTVTRMRIWLHHRYRIVLPIITSRGVKYTHDINCTVLHSNRGPLGLCGISQASDPKKVVVTDPPTARHNVATPHAVATLIHGGVDPTTTSSWAYGVYSHIEANYFGKDFLRMAGIVQMLHARIQPYDKYPYAHP